MKKLIPILLAIAMILALPGCSNADVEAILTDIVSAGMEESAFLEGSDTEDIEKMDGIYAESPDDGGETEDSPGNPESPDETDQDNGDDPEKADTVPIARDGWYYSAKDVALYLDTYGCLPENFITKSEARDLGWEGGSVEEYAAGYAIGGDTFGNREGILPEEKGRTYYECDIDTNGKNSRGAKRIVYSNDGLIFYTEDHYESFTLLYGETE